MDSLEEEAYLLARIFFDLINRKRFKGVARNHLRALRKLLEYNYGLMYTEKEEMVNEMQVQDSQSEEA